MISSRSLTVIATCSDHIDKCSCGAKATGASRQGGIGASYRWAAVKRSSSSPGETEIAATPITFARAHARVQQEAASPVLERQLTGRYPSRVSSINRIHARRTARTCLRATAPGRYDIRPGSSLVAKEASALLERVGCPGTRITRHIGHRKTFDREPTINRLTADEDIGS